MSTTSIKLLAIPCTGALLALTFPSAFESLTSYNAAPGYGANLAKSAADAVDAVESKEVEPVWEERAIGPAGRAMVHSVTVIELADGGLRAFWYGGSREGAGDVGIYTARLAPNEHQWDGVREIMNRAKLWGLYA